MNDSVEFRYLDIKWINEKTVKSLEASQDTISIETLNGDHSIETFTYQKHYPRIGLKIHSGMPLHRPYFKDSLENKVELLPIKDPKTNAVWWIHSDGWDPRKNYYHTELFRTVGRADLYVQNQLVTINNNAVSLNVDDLEAYLQDFKRDLWQIIFSQNSAIKGTVSKNKNILSEESLQFFKDFTDSLEGIIKKVGVELKETQEQKPIKSVRPVNRTFREIATMGFKKQHTSRSYIESYNTPDNRYLHYCTKRILYISKQLSNILREQKKYLSRLIDTNNKIIVDISSRKSKSIEKDVFDDETSHIESRLNELNIQLEQAQINQVPISEEDKNLPFESYELSIGSPFAVLKNYYFVNEINGKRIQGNVKYKGENSYAVVGVADSIFKLIEQEKNEFKSFKLTIRGRIKKGWDITSARTPFSYLYFFYVDSIGLPEQLKLQNELSQRASRRLIYQRDNWEVMLNSDEKKESLHESKFLIKKNSLFKSSLESHTEISKKMEPISLRLTKLSRFFKDKNVKPSAIFPSTMSFVQNHLYSKAKSSFSKINNLDGMDGDLISSISTFEKIGIINIPILYERWCLLQIIKLLTEVYGFSLAGNWQSMLIQSVINNQRDIEFEFINSISDKRITLGYEKTLSNGKVPDFVLDIEYQGYVFRDTDSGNIKRYDEYGNENLDLDESTFDKWHSDGLRQKRFIIDAKFKDNQRQSGFEFILDDLIDNKNYDEDGNNPVFILHPQSNAIQHKTSPLDWGKHSDYGQNIKHNKGFVFLLPSSKHGNTLDNLQRLLGMFLQSISYFIDYGKKNHWTDTVCISCGASSLKDFDVKKGKTKGGKNKWEICCKNCSHSTKKTVCYKCGGDLYKNQFTWTYHRTKAEQISNVVCPSCQVFL